MVLRFLRRAGPRGGGKLKAIAANPLTNRQFSASALLLALGFFSV
jgi:hypothetical protein